MIMFAFTCYLEKPIRHMFRVSWNMLCTNVKAESGPSWGGGLKPTLAPAEIKSLEQEDRMTETDLLEQTMTVNPNP